MGTAVLAVVSVVAALLTVVIATVAGPGPASATPTSGTGGLFTATQGRIVDTRNGTGGYSTPNSGARAYDGHRRPGPRRIFTGQRHAIS